MGCPVRCFFGLEPRTEEMGLEDPHLLWGKTEVAAQEKKSN